jgi:predicted transcriptional regulator YheO
MRDVWAERKFNNSKVENISANVINKKARKQILGKKVIVKNIDTNGLTEYLSISEAAVALNISRPTLYTYVKNQKILTILKQEGNVLMKENLLITVE